MSCINNSACYPQREKRNLMGYQSIPPYDTGFIKSLVLKAWNKQLELSSFFVLHGYKIMLFYRASY